MAYLCIMEIIFARLFKTLSSQTFSSNEIININITTLPTLNCAYLTPRSIKYLFSFVLQHPTYKPEVKCYLENIDLLLPYYGHSKHF